MSGRKPRTSRALICTSVLLCLFLGGSVRQSSGTLTTGASKDESYMFVAGNEKAAPDPSSDTVTADTDPNTDAQTTPDAATPALEITATPTPEPTPTPAVENVSTDYVVSPEAATGVWRPDGSNWRFLVDGNSYTGWLNDTDGKRYFFNSDGIMQTGLVDYENKRYYFDADGILQTGDVVINGKTYHFLEDGSLEGYDVAAAAAAKEAEAAQEADTQAQTDQQAQADVQTPADEQTQTGDTQSSADVQADDANTTDAAQDTDDSDAAATDAAQDTDTSDAADTDATDAVQDIQAETPQTEGTLALTFDDGPAAYTERLLDCLEANDAKATFFLVGQEVDKYPDTVKRIASLGCELGGHSYTHNEMTTFSADDIIAEVWATNQAIESLTGQATTVLRPPYDAVNDTILSNAKNPVILNSTDINDKEATDAQTLADAILNAAADGAILELHDTNEITVIACETAIPKLISMGYRLATVHELADEKGVELVNGATYSSITSNE